jgi:putative ABC transport system permease protein
MHGFIQDIRYAVRQLRRSPGFALSAILMLALGLGACAAVWSVVQAVLLAPLPYTDPGRLVGVAFTFPHEKANAEQTGASADFIRDHVQAFASTAVTDDGSIAVNLSMASGHPAMAHALRVSEGYFRTLGAMPMLGRSFTADEDRAGGPHSVILGYGLWQRAFGADAGIVGREVRLNQESFTVVGVMPADFVVSSETAQGVLGEPDLWMPLQLSPRDPGYDGDNYIMIARLRAGVTLAQAQQQLTAMQAPFYAQFPAFKDWHAEGNSTIVHEFRLWPLREVVAADARTSLIAVLGAVLSVLMVACLNLAGLMIARGQRRAREIALRTALGASGAQVVRLVAVEGAVIGLAGGLLGIVVARAACHFLLQASPLPIPQLHGEPRLGVLSVAVAVLAAISTLLFAALPGAMVLRGRSKEARLNGPTLSQSVSQARFSRILLITQVGLAMVLVSMASILLGTFVKLRALPSGVEPRQLSVFQVALKGQHYATTQPTMQFVEKVLDKLRATPGVERAVAMNGLPLDRGLNEGGNPADRRNLQQIVEIRAITPGYFQTMGMPILAGRDIKDDDRAGADRVVLIGATAARKWWPGRSPIGESVEFGGRDRWRIVGVVPDVQMHSLVEAKGIQIYAPMAQVSDDLMGVLNGWFPTSFAVRSSGHINIVADSQRAVEEADPEIPVARFTTMEDVIDSTIQAPRFFSALATAFSAFALALTMMGLFGLLSYQISQRTREIGLRMALGANRGNILRAYVGRGLALAGAGITAGLIAAAFLRPVLGRLLADFGINAPAQRLVTSATSAAMLAVCTVLAAAVVASWLPARRAAAIEPMQALRTE